MRINPDEMPRCILMIRGTRDGYAPEQIGSTTTVGELKEFLDGYNDDTPIMLNNDRGYTYGSICIADIAEAYDYEDYKTFLDEGV